MRRRGTAELASATFDHLGVPVTTNKTEGPSTCVTFLGIIVDTATLQLEAPWFKAAEVAVSPTKLAGQTLLYSKRP